MDSRIVRLDQLTDDMSGVFDVHTEDGAVHRLDLDGRAAASFINERAADLDVQRVQLLILATCRVGARMVMLIDRGAPGVRFTRRTTAVVCYIRDARGIPLAEVERS